MGSAHTCGRCGALLARDNDGGLCSPCVRSGDRWSGAPEVPSSFWHDERVQAALADRHMGRVIRAYRHHRYHGRRPLPQETVAGWLGLTQAQLSRIESGHPVAHLERLVQWATVLGVPERYLWFALPDRRFDSTGRAGSRDGFSGSAEDEGPEELEEFAQASERIRWLRAPNVAQETIVRLDGLVERYARAYEEAGAGSVYRLVLRQRAASTSCSGATSRPLSAPICSCWLGSWRSSWRISRSMSAGNRWRRRTAPRRRHWRSWPETWTCWRTRGARRASWPTTGTGTGRPRCSPTTAQNRRGTGPLPCASRSCASAHRGR